MYSCRYGTFLYNTERERAQTNVKSKTESIWTYILSHKELYTNYAYLPIDEPLWPCTSIRMIRLWEEYFLRHDPEIAAITNRIESERQGAIMALATKAKDGEIFPSVYVYQDHSF